MIAEDLRQCANDNLVETYFGSLGRARVRHLARRGLRLASAVSAIRSATSPSRPPRSLSARRLKSLAMARPAFHVYLLPDAASAVEEETLNRADFRPTYTLISMSAGECPKPPPIERKLDMQHAADPRSRDRVAAFMSQLFLRQSGSLVPGKHPVVHRRGEGA